MLDRRNIQTRRPCKKLDHKRHGPFQVEKQYPLPQYDYRYHGSRELFIISSTYHYWGHSNKDLDLLQTRYRSSAKQTRLRDRKNLKLKKLWEVLSNGRRRYTW
jgi:hypothetical protein